MTDVNLWGSYDTATADQEAEESAALGSGLYKPREGENQLRVCPPGPGRTSPFVYSWGHYIELPGRNKKDAIKFVCPTCQGPVNGEPSRPCRACQKAQEFARAPSPAMRQLAKAFEVKRRVFANVVDRASENLGPRPYAFGKTIHDALLSLRRGKRGGDFSDPSARGFDVWLMKSGEGMNTRYTLERAGECSPLHADPAVVARWAQMLPDLTRYTIIPTDEEIEELLAGGGAPRRERALPTQPSVDDYLHDESLVRR